LLILSAAGLVAAAGAAHAQSAPGLIIARDAVQSVRLQAYGGKDIREDADHDNSAALQAYCDAVDAGTERRALDLRGFWGRFYATVTTPTKHGMTWICAGRSMARSENDWLAGAVGIGGPSPTRLIWAGDPGGGECFIDYRSPSWRIEGILNIWGFSAPTRNEMKASVDNYVDVGIRVKSRDDVGENVSYGKIDADGIHFIMCEVGLQGGTTYNGANGDEFAIGDLRCMFCAIGVDLVSRQCVVHRIGRFGVCDEPIDDVAKQIGIRIQAGGHLSIQQTQMEVNNMTLLLTESEDDVNQPDFSGPDVNSSLVDLGQVWLDGNLTQAGVRVVDFTEFTDAKVRCWLNTPSECTQQPLFVIRGRGGLDLSGNNFGEEIVQIRSALSHEPGPVRIHDARMRSGASAANLIYTDASPHADHDGWVDIQSVYGFVSGVTNQTQQWANGVKTTHAWY
jgi:hypothetical protein